MRQFFQLTTLDKILKIFQPLKKPHNKIFIPWKNPQQKLKAQNVTHKHIELLSLSRWKHETEKA